jgi:hypothetical protein
MEKEKNNVFDEIMLPLYSLLNDVKKELGEDADKYKLSFIPFTINMLFGIFNIIKSVSLLITEIRTSPIARKLNLVNASKSMYSEAFVRYDAESYRKLFVGLLETLDFMGIPEISHLGRFLLIDGSLFPAMVNMQWAHYKTNANAIKLHVSFDLNHMIPIQFISTEGNYSERKFLKNILEAGVTYICDRGYICFESFKEICSKGAFFIIRGKTNLQFAIKEQLTIIIPDNFSKLLSNVSDMKIVFTNDISQRTYRIVTFTTMGETYILITNRFDLTTYEVIMLYAYRWQVELLFRFLMRTFAGIHLMTHDPEGIRIQFYLYMIAYLLLLSFEQKCAKINDANQAEKHGIDESEPVTIDDALISDVSSQNKNICGLVSLLGNKLKTYWKIGIHWLTVVKNLLIEQFEPDIVKLIAQQH